MPGRNDPPSKLTWFYHNRPREGYGYSGAKIAQALQNGNHLTELRIVDMLEDGDYTRFGAKRWDTENEAVALCVPGWWPDLTAKRLAGFTMIEMTGIPEMHLKPMLTGAADLIIVPAQHSAEVFREAGIRCPIHVVPLGVDPLDFPLQDRSRRIGPYRILWSGTPDYRKGWDLAYRAFHKAFRGTKADVHLTLHFRKQPDPGLSCRDHNVTILHGSLPMRDYRRLLNESDLFVFPSRGEGWGLPPREAAATGKPVVATNWGGLQADIEHWALPLDVTGTEQADYGPWPKGTIGEWAMPDVDHLAHLMQWCYDNREIAAQAGHQASAWLSQHRSWRHTATGILEALAC